MLEINNQTKEKIDIKKTKEIVDKFLRSHQRTKCLVSLAIVSPDQIRILNKKYRGQNQITDVLSFSWEGNYSLFLDKQMIADQELLFSKNKLKNPTISSQKLSLREDHLDLVYLGEIIINISETKKISKYQKTLEEIGLGHEKKAHQQTYLFYFLLIHGLLHLISYNDLKANERLKMLKLGRDFLEKVL